MKRTFLVAGLSMAVVFGASVAIILALSSPPPTPATPDPSSPIAVAPAPPTPPVAAAPFKGGKLYLSATGLDLRPNGERRGGTSMPTADRVTQKLVRKALLAAPVQSRLARCVDQVGGFGGSPGVGPVPRSAPAVLMLEMEGLGGELRIVDAPVHSWGGASEAAVSCARNVLRGQVVAASKAGRGERLRMPFPLNPRSEVVAASR